MKTFIAAAAIAAAIAGAPPAQASPLNQDEINFINDINAIGIVNTDGNLGVLEGGYSICEILSEGYPRSWVAEQVYIGSQESNGAAGITFSTAQALVFYANSDLCPGVGR